MFFSSMKSNRPFFIYGFPRFFLLWVHSSISCCLWTASLLYELEQRSCVASFLFFNLVLSVALFLCFFLCELVVVSTATLEESRGARYALFWPEAGMRRNLT